MVDLNYIFHLINILNSDEKRVLLSRYKKDDKNFSKSDTISLILKGEIISLENLQEISSDSKNTGTLRKQLFRLNERIYDVLLNGELIDLNSFYDERAKQVFKLLSKLLLSDILTYRGLGGLSEKILDKVIADGRYYEHFDIISYGLSKKLSKKYLQRAALKKLESEIKDIQKLSLSFSRIVQIYYKYNNIDTILKKGEALSSIEKDFQIANKLSQKNNNSRLIGFYFRLISMLYSYLKNDFYEGLIKSNEMIIFFSENTGIQSSIRFLNVYLYNSIFYTFNFRFIDSLNSLGLLSKYYKETDLNAYICKEKYFLNYLLLNDIPKAKYYYNAIRNYEFPFNKYFIKYYGYVLNYINFKENKSFDQIEYPNDSSGSLVIIGIRIIQIISFLDKERFDLADNAIDSFRKFLNKQIFRKYIDLRLKLILNLLWICRKESYNFKNVVDKNYTIFEQLTYEESCWAPFPHELILLEEWILAKSKGKAYNHGEVMAKMTQRHLENKSRSSLHA